MHRYLFLLIVLCCNLSYAQVDLEQLRYSLEKVKSDETYAFEVYEQLKGNKLTTIQQGYYGVIEAMLAEHVFNPATKIAYFNAGKNKLEEAIKKEDNNVELRYLRFAMQSNIPFFLGYKSDLEKDKNFIVSHIESQKQKLKIKMVTKIVSVLMSSEYCTESDKAALKKVISGE